MDDDPTARVLRLLSLLQSRRYWTGEELADRLGVTERTVRRDVGRLRNLGYLVDSTPGLYGGYRMAAGTQLTPLLLDVDEAVALAIGLREAASAAINGIEDTTLRALAKLEHVLPDRLRRRVTAVHDHVVPLYRPHRQPGVDPNTLAALAQACRDHEGVQFEYQRRDGEHSRRRVRPHQLVSTRRRWYLAAYDTMREAWRTFRVDRMSNTALDGGRFQPLRPPTGSAASFVADALGSWPRAHVATLTARGAASHVKASLVWADADITPIDDRSCTVVVRADHIPELVATIAMVGVDHRVTDIEPSEVRDGITELIERLTPSTPTGETHGQ